MPELLEFEEPVGVLLKEIEALSMLPQTPERQRSIESLRRRADEIRQEIFRSLTPWQRVLVARHSSRPNTLDYIERLFTDFDELHGDRRFADDHAIVTGLALYKGAPIAVIGHQKGRDTKQKIFRNFGYARPEGYRKALRVMHVAQKFSRPIVVFVDTPAAYPGMESEERGVAEAIALNLREMIMIDTPIVVVVCGSRRSRNTLSSLIHLRSQRMWRRSSAPRHLRATTGSTTCSLPPSDRMRLIGSSPKTAGSTRRRSACRLPTESSVSVRR